MAKISTKYIPEIFNQIIRTRVADYIEKEVKELVKIKTDEIITDVLINLKLDAKTYMNMAAYEQRLVVTAIYNGVEIPQEDK